METRTRSFWAWGYEERFPGEEARRTLGQLVQAVLGLSELTPQPLPRLEEVVLPAPSIAPPAALGALVTAERSARVHHTYGRGYRDLLRAFRGDFRPAPDLVATPQSAADVERILGWCAGAGVVVVPYGGGTSVVGGLEVEPAERRAGVLSLDLARMGGLLELDPTSRLARFGAGASGPAVEAALKPHGLTLRHYPQSFEHSTVGGWIATRAGGHYATLYTHIEELLAGVALVTPSGILSTRPLPASGAGPSPERLVAGSEGGLGVITEAWLRLNVRPRFRAQASVRFARFEEGVLAARTIAQAALHPANCRLLDAREARLFGVATDDSCVLLLAFESADHPQEARLDRATELARAAGGVLGEREEKGDAESWKQAFLEAPYLQSALVSLGVLADTFETACTWSQFPALHAAIVEGVRAAMKRTGGKGHLSCRFTHVYPDGPAPYYTFLLPARRGGELEQWAEIKAAASEALLAHGGTITHHHAVGRLHRPYHRRERPALWGEALSAVKGRLDPGGIMNPGVLI